MNLSRLMPWDLVRSDRMLRVVFTALMTVVVLLLTVSSCAIWPAIFSIQADAASPFSGVCRAVLITAIPLMVAEVAVAVVLGWFDRQYSLVRSAVVTYFMGLIALITVLFAVPADLSAVMEVTGAVQVLKVIITLLLGGVLAFLPALLSSLLGWLVREVYYVVSEMRR